MFNGKVVIISEEHSYFIEGEAWMKTQTKNQDTSIVTAEADEASLRLTAAVPENGGSHIAHPQFYEPDAEQKVFGKSGVSGPLPGRPGTVLTAEEEKSLFIQYNYCRFRVAREIEALQEPAASAQPEYEEMMKWHNAGLHRRNRIIECNLGLVAMMIRNFRTESADYDELASEGNLTLLFAVNKFDVNRGFRFSTYACQAIHHAMMQAAARRGRRPWASLAEDIDLASEEVDATRPLIDEIRQVHEIIHRNDAQLSEVELKVIRSRFALPSTMVVNARLDPMTREQVGQLIGVSKVRIRQIERNALSKLRVAFKHLNVA